MALNLSTGFRSSLLAGTSWKTLFDGGVIYVYTGTQPDTADEAVTGTLLGKVTINGGEWDAGLPTNGLTYVQNTIYIQKTEVERWFLATIAAGIAGWFRIVGNAMDVGSNDVTLPRVDGAIGTTDAPAEMIWDATGVLADTTYSIDSFLFAFPPI